MIAGFSQHQIDSKILLDLFSENPNFLVDALRHNPKKIFILTENRDLYIDCLDSKDARIEFLTPFSIENPLEICDVFDIIISHNFFNKLDSCKFEKYLEWAYASLKPYGRLLCQIETCTSLGWMDLNTFIDSEAPHLLFSKTLINNFLRDKDIKELNRSIFYTGATIVFTCRSVGFNITDVIRISNNLSNKLSSNHSKLSLINDVELSTSGVFIELEKASEESDLSIYRKAK